jgi:hypothetical protein
MRRSIYFLIILSILMFACTISTPGTPPVVTELAGGADTPVVFTETPFVTEPPVPVTNVICNELAFHLDPALASGYNCETVPESPEGMEVHPQYTNLTLQGYVLSGKFFNPHISVFPVQRYTELLPEFLPGLVSDLQALIGGGATGDSLPLLPSFNAGQVFHAQYRLLPFASGGGIRYLTEYAQYFAPINNNELFYTYQGLTSDGKYWVSAILPVNNPILPDNADNPPGGVSWDEFNDNFESYITDITDQLNSQTSDNYTPNLAALDALVASITIQP